MKSAPDLDVYTDGASRGNPGPAAIGYAIRDRAGSVLEKDAKYIGTRTNNEAEWEALLWGLEKTLERTKGKVVFHSDSLDVVSWVSGGFATRDERMREYRGRVLDLTDLFDSFDIVYLPREDPRMRFVDDLVNEVLTREGHPRRSRK
ncbi:MAG: ribonuclease HI family protein [Thermoplasmata archaeon]